MENDSVINKFLSKLTYLLNDNENDSEKAEEKFFGKYNIAILKVTGILLTNIIISFGLRFVVQPAYWLFIDIFSVIFLATLTYYIVIRKLFRTK